MKKKNRIISAALAAEMISVIILSGCAGPSTRILPREILAEQEIAEKMPVLEEANPFYLQESLAFLAEYPRVIGSDEEQAAAEYMKQLLTSYGYEVTLQRFSVENQRDVMGTNVTAVRKTSYADADIVIVGSHYDTEAGMPGAGECAAGAAAMLETARLLARMPSDTELRFVCFSGQGDGIGGARSYVNSLTEEERSRVVGEIQLGELGCTEDYELILGTTDGNGTLLGDMFNETVERMRGLSCEYKLYERGAYNVFVRGQMPAVYLGQKEETYEYGSPFDRIDLVETDQLAQVVDLLSQTISELMSTDTHSMLARSRFQNDIRDGAYTQGKEAALPFGQSREELERRTGQYGVLVTENTDNDGKMIFAYRYLMKWFGVDQLLLTDYYFTDGKLNLVTVDGDGAGVGLDEMRERLCSVYGEETEGASGPDGTEYIWQDPLNRASFAIIPTSDGYELEIREYDPGRTVIETGPRMERLMMLVRQLLPVSGNIPNIDSVSIYTDGIGNTENYLEVSFPENEDGTAVTEPVFAWGIDLEDAIDTDGNFRNRADTVRMLLRLYGETLAEAEDGQYLERFRTELSDETEAGTDPEEKDGSSEREEDGQEDSFQGPEGARDDVAAEPGMHPGIAEAPAPDFAESFQWFVLAERPQDEAFGWGKYIRFFYEFEELAEYRSRVRENLGLDPEGLSKP